MLRTYGYQILILLFVSFSGRVHSQSLEYAASLNHHAEKNLTSGLVLIEAVKFDQNVPVDSAKRTLRFYKDPINNTSMFTLEDGFGGAYFSNGEDVSYWFDGYVYNEPFKGFDSRYYWGFSQAKEILNLGLIPEKSNTWLMGQWSYHQNNESYRFEFDSLTRTVRSVRTFPIVPDSFYQRIIHTVCFNKEWLPISYESVYTYDTPDTIIERKEEIIRFHYSQLNQVPFFEVKKDIEQYKRAKVIHLQQPDSLFLDAHPKPGQAFPDLHLLDMKGMALRLSDIKKKKLLVYYGAQGIDRKQVFRFVDSLQHIYPDIEILLLTRSLGVLEDGKNLSPEIRKKHFVCSGVSGLYINGFPVWFLVDEKNLYVSENHGFQIQYVSNITDWLNSHLKQP